MKDYKVKLSGNKLRINGENFCTSIDLELFPLLEVKKDKKTIVFIDSGKELYRLDMKSPETANALFKKISNKIYKKNNKFLATVFLTKIALGVFIFFIVMNLLSGFFNHKAQQIQQRAISVKQQAEMQMLDKQEQKNISADINKAKGFGVPVEDVFSFGSYK